jgi:hypothetical protein
MQCHTVLVIATHGKQLVCGEIVCSATQSLSLPRRMSHVACSHGQECNMFGEERGNRAACCVKHALDLPLKSAMGFFMTQYMSMGCWLKARVTNPGDY